MLFRQATAGCSRAAAHMRRISECPALVRAQIGGAVDTPALIAFRAIFRDRHETHAHGVAGSGTINRGDSVVAPWLPPFSKLTALPEPGVPRRVPTSLIAVVTHSPTRPGRSPACAGQAAASGNRASKYKGFLLGMGRSSIFLTVGILYMSIDSPVAKLKPRPAVLIARKAPVMA
jgi:hypothetical protein